MTRILACVVVAALSACASTSIRNEWRAPEDAGPALSRVIVVGVTRREDVRHAFEDAFAAALGARGATSIPSHGTLPTADLESAAKVQQAARAAGADGMLVTRLLYKGRHSYVSSTPLPVRGAGGFVRLDRETFVTPAARPASPYDNVYGYYPDVWEGAYTPPYTPPGSITYDVVVLETRVYRVSSETLVWAGATETFAPSGDIRAEMEAFARLIVGALAKARLL